MVKLRIREEPAAGIDVGLPVTQKQAPASLTTYMKRQIIPTWQGQRNKIRQNTLSIQKRHKMNKRNTLLGGILVFMVMMTVACGSHHQESTVADSTQTDSITVVNERVTVMHDPTSNATIIGLQDKATEQRVDLFKGSYDDSLLAALIPGEGARSAINVFLVKFPDGPTVLFDAGIGGEEGFMSLHQMKPEEVDAVCLTHLHPDHIGGLLAGDEALFPNATLYLSQTENASVSQWDQYSPLLATWNKIQKAYAGRIETFADNAALFDGKVQSIPAPGHTPGHTLFRIGQCLIAGDIVHSQDLQLEHPEFCARYDQDPTTAVATRKEILAYVQNNHLQLCGAHCYEMFVSPK